MKLGAFFPPSLALRRVRDQLRPGLIIYLTVSFPKKTKQKYLLLVSLDEHEVRCLMINSETSAFVLARPHLAKCQVSIDVASHAYLEHDSRIACDEVWRFARANVEKELAADLSCIKGAISDGVREQVLSAVKHAVTLSPKDSEQILLNLTEKAQ